MGGPRLEVVEKRDQILARWSRKAGRLTETLALCMYIRLKLQNSTVGTLKRNAHSTLVTLSYARSHSIV